MKKLLSLVLCLVLVFSMAACGNSNAGTTTTTPTKAPVESSQTGTTTETTPANTVVEDAAMGYFANFADDRNMISIAKLLEKMVAGEEVVILDIRRADDYNAGHLKGAVNIPYGTAIAENLEKIPDDVVIYVNCYSGQTSSQTVSVLRAAGKYTVNIQGGWKAISAAEGVADFTETTANTFPEGTYAVADEMEKAILDYYTAATTGTYSSFNFPVAAAKELVDAQSDAYTFVSVRSADDYAAGHIPGAINIPFGKNMQESFNKIPKDKPVIVYCYSGQTSSQTMGILRLLGFEAYSLLGGSNGDAGALMTEK